jgi:hypothetical protein
MCRSRNGLGFLLPGLVLSLGLLASSPVFAGTAGTSAPAPRPALLAQEAAEPGAADCAPDPLAALPAPSVSPVSKVEGPACRLDPDAAPAALPEQTKSCIPGVNCTKHCACTCSRIKDCNVNSDCSNHRCFTGISCC